MGLGLCLLEDGVYIPTDMKVKQMKRAKPDYVAVQKKFSKGVEGGGLGLGCGGFRLVEIFNKIMGFFMRFEDHSVESAEIVNPWNVKIISVGW